MTTHYQKIQALGNRMASNLETMGVSASFNDGGLTLADKILQIQHFTDGLLLFADKKIEQVGTTQSPNTITLSALLIENGKAKSGETVMFYGNWNVRQEKISTQSYTVYTVDGDGEFSFTGIEIRVNQGVDYSVGLGSASTFKITISNSTFSFAINGSSDTIYGFTYDSTKPLEIWIPIEATNISNKFGYSDTTDSSGIATCEYTCTGAGLKTITAESGTFVSEIFVVTDSQFYDSGTTGTPNTEWWKNNNSLQLTSDNNGLNASNSTSSTYYLAPNEIGTPKSSMSDLVDWNNFICEFTYRSHTGTINLELRDSGGNVGRIAFNNLTLSDGDVFKIQYTNNTITATLNNTPLTVSGTVSGDVMIRLAVLNANIVFKDFKVYPI